MQLLFSADILQPARYAPAGKAGTLRAAATQMIRLKPA
jgi:hypothetical protein